MLLLSDKCMIRNGGRLMIIPQRPISLLPRHDACFALNVFRSGFYDCLTRRADVLFELTDAVSCGTSPVTDLARLSLEVEHHRGHGGLYDALNAGVINTDQLRAVITGSPIPKITTPDGHTRIVLAVDVSNWLRPDAATSPDRAFCHTYARGRGQADMIPVGHTRLSPRWKPVPRPGPHY